MNTKGRGRFAGLVVVGLVLVMMLSMTVVAATDKPLDGKEKTGDVEIQDTSFTVNVDHSPSTVEVGETGQISVTVENTDSTTETQTIDITAYRDGTLINSVDETLTIDPGESVSENVPIQYTQQDVGDWMYEVCTEDECDSTSWTVVENGGNGDPGGNDRFEPNDERITATSISPGFYSDLDIVAGESDYFEISLDQGDEITATMQFDHTVGDLDLELQDSEGNELRDSISVTDDETVTYEVQESGTFYVRAYGFIDAGAPYSLDISVDDGIEQNTPPEASFTYSPLSPDTSEAVTFDASGSSDTDGSIQRYEWEFGDGSTATATGETVTHTYSSSGTYTVELTVRDEDGATDTTTGTVTVDEAPPVVIDAPSTTQPGGEFEFDVTMTESGVGEVAVESSDFDVELSVVDDAGDSIGAQTDTSVEFIDIDSETSTYTLRANVTGGTEGDTGTITAANGGNIGDSDVDQTSTTFSLADVLESPAEDVPDDLWTAVTQNDNEQGLSLGDLGNAIQTYRANPGNAEVGGVDIGLSDLGSLIQYYRNQVA
jgi:PKD repeat protein